ncbi:MAG: DNA recombination/repair protein RecA [Acidobacteriota bacterium]|nr:DNA recombination/repair protein RecA [Acidobacteriota bacterium]
MNAAALRNHIQTSLGHRFDVNLTLREKTAPELLSSGIPGIDIPRGKLTEIYGPASSGRTSILIAVLARVTRQPEFCALIDASDSFDPRTAAEAGVQLPNLLWVRCGGGAENALKAADLIVQAGGFGVVALDLAGIPARDARRISLASWFRLRGAVEKTPTALVVVEQELNAHSCSTLQIGNRPAGVRMKGKLLRGLGVDATLGPRNRAKSTFTLKPLYWE